MCSATSFTHDQAGNILIRVDGSTCVTCGYDARHRPRTADHPVLLLDESHNYNKVGKPGNP